MLLLWISSEWALHSQPIDFKEHCSYIQPHNEVFLYGRVALIYGIYYYTHGYSELLNLKYSKISAYILIVSHHHYQQTREPTSPFQVSHWPFPALNINMRFSSVILAPLFALSTVAAYTPASTANTDQLAADGLSNLATWAADGNLNGSCTLENAAVRREW